MFVFKKTTLTAHLGTIAHTNKVVRRKIRVTAYPNIASPVNPSCNVMNAIFWQTA